MREAGGSRCSLNLRSEMRRKEFENHAMLFGDAGRDRRILGLEHVRVERRSMRPRSDYVTPMTWSRCKTRNDAGGRPGIHPAPPVIGRDRRALRIVPPAI